MRFRKGQEKNETDKNDAGQVTEYSSGAALVHDSCEIAPLPDNKASM